MKTDGNDLAAAIEKLGEKITTAKAAELAHLREINSTLTGIQAYLQQIVDALKERQQEN